MCDSREGFLRRARRWARAGAAVASVAVASVAAARLPAQRAPTSAPPFDGAAVDAAVRREMERQRIPGVAVAVVRGGDVLLARGYGYANLEHRVPVTDETMFESGSLGKQFTAAGVMALVEDGRLRLDASVRAYLPDAPAAWQPITLRHLLSHTSGIPDYTGDQLDYRRDYAEADLLRLAYALPPEFPAGARWNYSNTGYVVLGVVASRAAGRPYWELLRDRVYRPAGMPTVRVISEREIVPHRAEGYLPDSAGWRHQDWVSPSLNTTADGSMLLSLRDVVAWNAAVRGRRVLRPESWARMLAPVTLASGRPYPYGFGWFVDSLGGQVVHHHGGSWQGFRTQFTRYEGADVAVAVLANSGAANPREVAEAVAAAVDPALAPPAPPNAVLPDGDPAAAAAARAALDKAARGTLSPADFAFVRQTTFPRMRAALQRALDGLGAPERLELLARARVGDDRRLEYRAVYAPAAGRPRAMRATVTLAPDGRLTGLAVRPEPAR